jgi:hypothetical protein
MLLLERVDAPRTRTSAVDLIYEFTIADGEISALSIHP